MTLKWSKNSHELRLGPCVRRTGLGHLAFGGCLMGVPRYANGKLCEVMVGMISEAMRESETDSRLKGKKHHYHLSFSVATRGANRLKNIYCCSCTVAQLHSCNCCWELHEGPPSSSTRGKKDVPRQITDKGTNCSSHTMLKMKTRTGPGPGRADS